MRPIIALSVLAACLVNLTGCCCCCGKFYSDTIESYEYASPDDYCAAEGKTRQDRLKPVLEALEQYKAKTGTYPASLDRLVREKYLESIPNLADTTDHKNQPGRLRNATALKYKSNRAGTEFGLEFAFAQVGSRKMISRETFASEQKYSFVSADGQWVQGRAQSIDSLYNNYHGYDNRDLYHAAEAKARQERLQPVLDALAKYHQKHGKYPDALDDLVARKFLDSLPNTKTRTDHTGADGRIKTASDAIYKTKLDQSEYILEFGYDEIEHDRPNMIWAQYHSYSSKSARWEKAKRY